MREWSYEGPSKKGISLTLIHWKNLSDQLELADRVLHNKKYFQSHLSGKVYMTVSAESVCVEIDQYWKPENEVVPTRNITLKKRMSDVGHTLLEPDAVVPYYYRVIIKTS